MSIKEKLEEVTAIITKQLEEHKIKSQALINDTIKVLFDSYPDLKVIKWVQYAPYFNDGDACIFSVKPPYASNFLEINSYGDFDGDEDEELSNLFILPSWGDREKNQIVPDGLKKDFKAFSKFITNNANSDIMESIFGESVEVICTRNGIEIEEYDHS